MRVVLLVMILFVVMAAQVAWWPDITLRVMPALTLAAVVAWTFAKGMRSGLAAAVIAGIALDLYAQVSLGRFFIGMLLGFGVITFFTRGAAEDFDIGYRLLAALAAAVAYELWLLVVTALTTDSFPFFAELTQVATLNCAATLAAFLLFSPASQFLVRNLYAPHERPL